MTLDSGPVDVLGFGLPDPDDRTRLGDSLAQAVEHLRRRQAPAGWWKGELRTNVTMDAEDLLLRQFLGILDPADLAASARWIRSQQRPDGTWSLFEQGPADLSTTIEAYAALRLAGDPADAPHLDAARRFVLARGGIEASRVFTRIWLALFGEWSWEDLPAMPPELVLLPSWVPLNVYDWACWARQTVVPITVVATLRPVRPLPFTLGELRTHAAPAARVARASRRDRFVVSGFEALDRALKTYQRLPVQPGRQTAFRRAAEWIIARQESDGGWGGIQPPWVYSILALHLLGYPLDHPVLRAAVDGLEGFLVREVDDAGLPVRRLEACQSPVWDTALAVIGLLDAGVPADDPAVSRAVDWLLGEEVRVRGDWSVRRPDLEPGGWAFEFANDLYPDIDDTAEVVIALQRVLGARPERDAEIRQAIARGVRWVTGMQTGTGGGWGAFDADNTSTLISKLPFSDFGAVTDPPSADVTAHVLEMYAVVGDAGDRPPRPTRAAGCSSTRRTTARGSAGGASTTSTARARPCPPWSPPGSRRTAHRSGGPWTGCWPTRTPTAAGVRTCAPTTTRRGSAADRRPPPRRPGRCSPCTPRARTGLPVERALSWLATTQQPDGSWAEDLFTGTGFPGDFYINYELYRIVFPVAALGRLAVTAPAHPLVVTALRTEWLALRGHVPGGHVVRCGMGPDRVRDFVEDWPTGDVSAVVVAGVAGGLAPDVEAGDVVVASEVRDAAGSVLLHGASPLVAALRAAGFTVHHAPVLTTDHVVTGDRADLATSGAAAVDMESAPLVREALRRGAGPVAVVRVVVDTVHAPIGHLATVPAGARALATLRRIGPLLADWAGLARPRRALLAGPRSFCAGVDRAIEIVERALRTFPHPVYVRRQIVHNAHVVEDLRARGAVFVRGARRPAGQPPGGHRGRALRARRRPARPRRRRGPRPHRRRRHLPAGGEGARRGQAVRSPATTPCC